MAPARRSALKRLQTNAKVGAAHANRLGTASITRALILLRTVSAIGPRWTAFFRAPFLGLTLFLSLAPPAALAQVNVWTQHNDNSRTGANLTEVQLTTSNVNPSQFGKLFQYSADAPIFAQPLVISNLSIPNKGMRNVVFVATMNNSVYAFDADDPRTDSNQPIWQISFNKPAAGVTAVPSTDISTNGSYSGPVGVMGTPVIDVASGTMYLLARTKENGGYRQRLHALDIATGQERSASPVDISAAVISPDGTTKVFDPKRETQRAALALANGRVYIAWSSLEDIVPYQGWIMAYDATTLRQAGVFNTAPTGGLAGIWMSGQAPAVDASGNVYVVTGNGAWDGITNFGQSVLKLSPSLALLDWFTPDNWQATSSADLDLGSSGALLIPGTRYVVAGSKEGKLYLLDSTNMGHMAAGNTQIPQVFQSSTGNNIHGTPVPWSGPAGMRVYVWPETDFLKAYAFGGQSLNTSPVSQSTFKAPPGMPGGVLSLSANGNASGTGIVWASIPLSQDANPRSVPGVLRAFDANDLTNELWNSENKCSDEIGTYAKFAAPTVANGKVYLPTFSNQLLVYGLLSTLPSANPGLFGSVTCDSSNVNLTAVGTVDWAKWPGYVHKASGGAQISNFSVSGSGATQVASYTRAMISSDGTPVISGSDQSSVVVAGNGNQFRISVPADTTQRTLYVYVGGTDSAGRLVAHLSDGSAPDYVNALSGAGNYDVVYMLTYKAASAGQQLIVTWAQASDTGSVTLRAAALSFTTPSPVPPPITPTGVSATNGTSANSATVSWITSTNATSYTVYRSSSSGTLGSSVGTTNTASLTDFTVVPGTLYYYAVVATGDGGDSPPSPQVTGYAGTLVTYQISGTITQGGSTLSAVNLSASAGGTCTTSNTSGVYSCSVPQGWSGTVAPALVGYTFTPTLRSYASVGADQTTKNYAAVVGSGADTVWVDDAQPMGATMGSDGGDAWAWVSSNPAPFSGTLAHQSRVASGEHQHFFFNASATLDVTVGDTLFVYVYLDPANPPSEVMLQWHDGSNWEHRAYWGANQIPWGTDGSASRRYMGPLPALGQWVRLEVPAALVALEGRKLKGMAYTLYNGRASWDRAGKAVAAYPVWLDDALPTGASMGSDGGDAWNWVSGNPAPFSGTLAHQSALASGEHQHYFRNASATLNVAVGDALFAYVYLDPVNPPTEVMLQWTTDGSNWDHRAYWGANQIPWGNDVSAGRRYMGALPAPGQWARLEVPAALVALEGLTLTGMAYTLNNGRATWDRAGKAVVAYPVWVDDALPMGAAMGSDGGDTWTWVSSNPAPFSGTLAHQSKVASGEHQHFFFNASATLDVTVGDTLFVYVYLDPANPPSEVMLQWHDGTNWEHRAYWGANQIPWGTNGSASRRSMGTLPAAGQWVRLEVPAALVGMEGRTLKGMAYTLYNGRATWDRAGKMSP